LKGLSLKIYFSSEKVLPAALGIEPAGIWQLPSQKWHRMMDSSVTLDTRVS